MESNKTFCFEQFLSSIYYNQALMLANDQWNLIKGLILSTDLFKSDQENVWLLENNLVPIKSLICLWNRVSRNANLMIFRTEKTFKTTERTILIAWIYIAPLQNLSKNSQLVSSFSISQLCQNSTKSECHIAFKIPFDWSQKWFSNINKMKHLQSF